MVVLVVVDVVLPVALVAIVVPVLVVVPPLDVAAVDVLVPPVPFAMFGVAVTFVVPWARPATDVALETVVADPT